MDGIKNTRKNIKGVIDMPTGYTAAVQDGEITDVKDFVLRCARNFGAFIHMRDAKFTDKPKLREVSDYHLKRLEEAKERLENYQVKNKEDFEKEMQEWIVKTNKEREEYRNTKEIHENRYNDMLDKVSKWQPPTEDHNNLKEFCIKQLKESIKGDCYVGEWCKPLTEDDIPTYEDYVNSELKRITDDIEYHAKGYREEVEKVNECNKWITDLYESF